MRGSVKTEEFDIEDAETFALPVDEEKGKLSDPFYRLEHREQDLQKKKEAEPVMARLFRASDARHADDYSLNKAIACTAQNPEKKRVAEEEDVANELGLDGRLLPTTKENAAAAAKLKFFSKFERN